MLAQQMEDTLSDNPHSLLDAAKITAKALGLEWSVVHRYYRELQGPTNMDNGNWLPKSLGRNIWSAHPHFIARLIIALGSSSTPAEAFTNVTAISTMTPDGRQRSVTEWDTYFVERLIAKYLIEPSRLSSLDRIEFDPADNEVVFHSKDGSSERFEAPGSVRNWQRGFYWRGVITATVLETIAAEVRWRTYDTPPFGKVRNGEVDPDA